MADAAIDVGQGVALSPLLLASPGAYTAGVAANAAAEDMYEQTAKGKAASDAMGSGILTAGVEVAADKIKLEKAFDKVSVNSLVDVFGLSKGKRKMAESALKDILPNVSDAGVRFFLEYLADEAGRNPGAGFSSEKFLHYMMANGANGLFGEKAPAFYDELERAWDTLG